MSSRDDILANLSSNAQDTVPHPDLDQFWSTWPDPIVRFEESVATVGGQSVRLENPEDLTEAIVALEFYKEARRVASDSTHTSLECDPLDGVLDPHTLEDLDLFIADGRMGVAENGAVWLTDETLTHRVALFIPQHLILTVESNQIVNNMHEAYRRIQIGTPEFGVFVSGPSKTADIEQSLVIGAHGPRSLTVFILN